jgi:hypothetical protein
MISPTTAPQNKAHARPGTVCALGRPRKNPIARAANATITSSSKLSVEVELRANVAARAPNTTTSDHASVADTLRTPKARARSQPGASTAAVANASFR